MHSPRQTRNLRPPKWLLDSIQCIQPLHPHLLLIPPLRSGYEHVKQQLTCREDQNALISRLHLVTKAIQRGWRWLMLWWLDLWTSFFFVESLLLTNFRDWFGVACRSCRDNCCDNCDDDNDDDDDDDDDGDGNDNDLKWWWSRWTSWWYRYNHNL